MCKGKVQLYVYNPKSSVPTLDSWAPVDELPKDTVFNAGNFKIECKTCQSFWGTNWVWMNGISDFIRVYNTRNGVDPKGRTVFHQLDVEEDSAMDEIDEEGAYEEELEP
jgi:hypothetical protein